MSRPKKSRAEQWNDRLAEVRAFAHSQNRWPSTTAKDESEKKIAQWWSRQKYYYNLYEKNGNASGMNPERVSAMKNLIDSFSKFEREGIWMYRYNKVQRRIENHGQLWSYNTTDKEDEKTLRWWNQQKTFCRKFVKGEVVGGMTAERAKLVQELQDKIGRPLVNESESDQETEVLEEVFGFSDNTTSVKDDTDV